MDTPSLIGPLLAFAAVVAAIPLVAWVVKRTPWARTVAGGGQLRVVASLALAPNQRVVTLEVGQGADRRWLVLGVSPAGIQNLHTLPPQPEPEVGSGGSGSSGGKGFAPHWARARQAVERGAADAA